MIRSNYHLHSFYCDGHTDIRSYIERAIELGFHSIGMSSHSPVPIKKPYALQLKNLSDYLNELDELKHEYQGTIEVYSGIELDFHPDWVGFFEQHLFNQPFDYIVGSVHYIGNRPDGTPWFFERKASFDEGFHGWYQGDIQAVVRDYYNIIREMVSLGKVDFIGHIDRFKRQCLDVAGFDESADWYREEVDQTLKFIAEQGVMLEINLGGLRHPIQKPYPSVWILKRCKELGIGLTVNTDGHKLEHLSLGYSEALGFLNEAGYAEIYRLQNGRWVTYPIDC